MRVRKHSLSACSILPIATLCRRSRVPVVVENELTRRETLIEGVAMVCVDEAEEEKASTDGGGCTDTKRHTDLLQRQQVDGRQRAFCVVGVQPETNAELEGVYTDEYPATCQTWRLQSGFAG
jgi:hypothetical protein